MADVGNAVAHLADAGVELEVRIRIHPLELAVVGHALVVREILDLLLELHHAVDVVDDLLRIRVIGALHRLLEGLQARDVIIGNGRCAGGNGDRLLLDGVLDGLEHGLHRRFLRVLAVKA